MKFHKTVFASTKIVATLGPATTNYDKIKQLAQSGMDVARLNFSHGSKEDHKNSINIIRDVEKELGYKISILQDLQGPKIRTAKVENGNVLLDNEQDFIITVDDLDIGNSKIVSTVYKDLINEVEVGNRILLDDGYIILECKGKDEKNIYTKVIKGGVLKNNKGIIVPSSKSNAPSLSEKDIEDLKFGIECGVDMVALSFVKKPEDILELKTVMKIFGKQLPIIAKIERAEAFEKIDEIIKESDGIMVARGDLGLEMPLEELPLLQKELIRKANAAGKPVITATQMLESMIKNPIPTRAEVSDIANAVLDGTDAVMLSGETSVGDYPVESVDYMNKIILKTELTAYKKMKISPIKHNNQPNFDNISDSLALSTVLLASNIKAKAIITFTKSAHTARKIAKFRPSLPIIAITNDDSNLAYLNLIWGVHSFNLGDDFSKFYNSFEEENIKSIKEILVDYDIAKEKDLVVLIAGLSENKLNKNNFIKIIEI